jgi:hypothetical protein
MHTADGLHCGDLNLSVLKSGINAGLSNDGRSSLETKIHIASASIR